MLLFTDGITEASTPEGGQFGEAKLAALARTTPASTTPEINSKTLNQVWDFCGGQFQDDATVVAVN